MASVSLFCLTDNLELSIWKTGLICCFAYRVRNSVPNKMVRTGTSRNVCESQGLFLFFFFFFFKKNLESDWTVIGDINQIYISFTQKSTYISFSYR